MNVTRLLDEHSRLRVLGAELAGLVASAELCDLDELACRRWSLARMVHMHLAYEERHLFHRLAADPRADVHAAGARARRGVEQLHRSYKAHVERWTAEDIVRRWPEFQRAVRMMVSRMVDRIDLEEADLFPLVADDGETDRGWRPGMRNWAGEGVGLQPFINRAAAPPPRSAPGGVRQPAGRTWP